MPYLVQFVGLICFQPLGDGEGRRALLPDGRFPEDRAISPHVASISVRNGDVDLNASQGWRDDQVNFDAWETEFLFPPSRIRLPFGAKGPAFYREANLVTRVPELSKIDPKFTIGENANWIASIDIEQGEIEAVRFPGLPHAPLIAQLRVDYDDPIEITVTARKGWPTRTIVLRPGSEIAIINSSRGLAPRSDSLDHFRIYEELSAEPVTLTAPPLENSAYPESESRHPTFRAPRPATFVDTSCTPVRP